MTSWYYADAAGLQQGPVDAETLLGAYAAGGISMATLVWREGLADWQPLSSVAAELGLTQAPAVAGTGDDAVTQVFPTPLPATPADVVYAGFWRRFAANVIDGMAIGLLSLPITLPLLFIAGVSSGAGRGGPFVGLGVQLLAQAVGFFVAVSYYAGFHGSRLMATPGKLAVGIKVVRSDGARLGWGRSIGRGFAFYLGILTLYVGFLMAAFTRRKQGLHDLVCDTLVVDRWAFTGQPQYQKRGLDTVTIVILCLYALLLLVLLGALALILVVALAAGH